MKHLLSRFYIITVLALGMSFTSTSTAAQLEVNKGTLQPIIDETSYFDLTTSLQVGQEGSLSLNATNDDRNLLYKIIKLMITVMGTLAVLFYIIAAYFMMTSQGDENQIQKGKTIFLYTTLGVILAFLSYIIIQFGLNIIFKTA